MTNYTEEQLKDLRSKRITAGGRRAHWLCACGCTISGDKETCPQCNADPSTYTGFGEAILEYKREDKAKRFKVK